MQASPLAARPIVDLPLILTKLHLQDRLRMVSRPVACIAVVLAMQFVTPVAAQEWIYPVRPGDNLWNLAERFLDGFKAYGKLQALNHIRDPKRIPPGTGLRIPLAWMRRVAAEARITSVLGGVEIETDGASPRPAGVGDALRTRDRIRTAPDANVNLTLPDGSQVRVLGDSEVVVESMAGYANTRVFDSRLLVAYGRTESIAPTDRDGATRFELRTRAGVTSVRGTAFRVATSRSGDESHTEVLRGRVAAGNDVGTVTVEAGFGTVMAPGRPPIPPVALLAAPKLDTVPGTLARMPVQIVFPEVPGAVGYRIQVAANTEFSSLLVDVTHATPAVDLPDLADGRYAIRARGVDAQGLEGDDAVREVTITARPAAPLSEAPPTDALADATPLRFQWAPDGPAERLRYRFQLSRTAAFDPLQEDVRDLASPEYTPTAPLAPGLWFWRAAATHEVRGDGPFGEVRRLRRPAPAPAPAVIARTPQSLVVGWPAGPVHATLAAEDLPDAPVADAIVEGGTWSVPRPSPGRYRLSARTVEVDGFEGPDATSQAVVVLPLPQPPAPIAAVEGLALYAAPEALAWTAVEGEERHTTYRLQLEGIPSDPATTVDREGIEALSLAPGPLPPGLYRWRVGSVTAEDGAGEFTAWQTFRVLSPPPGAPAVSRRPATLAIRWPDPTRALHARLVTDEGTAVFDAIVRGGAVELARPRPGTYVLSARTVEADGFEGPETTSQSIVVPPPPLPPTAIAAVEGVALYAAPEALAWKAVAGEERQTTYRLQLERIPADPATTVNREGIKTLSLSPRTLPPGLYRWRVGAATAEDGPGELTAWQTFRVLSRPPGAPSVSRHPATLAIRWPDPKRTLHATLVAQDGTAVFDAIVNGGAVNPARPKPGTYVLSARTVEADGFEGPSATSQTIVIPPLPLPPAPMAAAEGTILHTAPESLTWVAVPGEERRTTYRLQLEGVPPNPATTVDRKGIATLSLSPGTLSPGLYRWRVGAATAEDGPGEFTAWQTFRVLSPPPGAPAVSRTPTTLAIRWPDSGPLRATLVAEDGTAVFDATVKDGAVNLARPKPGKYVLSARTVEADGFAGRSAADFTVDLPAPPAPPAPVSAPGDHVVPARPELRWEAAAPDTSYHVQIAPDANFASLVAEARGGTATHFAPASDLDPGSYRWRVAAATEADGEGAFSAPQTFRIEVPAPVMQPVAPSRGTLTLAWTAATPASAYEVQLARDAAFSNQVASQRATGPRAALVAPRAGRYFARVRGFDPDGRPGPFSEAVPVKVPMAIPWWLYPLMIFGIVP